MKTSFGACVLLFLAGKVVTFSLEEIQKEDIQASDRIYNGDSANIKDYPYQIHLENDHSVIIDKFAKMSFSTFCGGSLIREDYVLTAAHCVHDKELKKVLDPLPSYSIIQTSRTVRAGTSINSAKGEAIKVSEIFAHPKYSATLLTHDIAVLKLAKPFKLSPLIQLIALPEPTDRVRVGMVGRVTGWGKTELDDQAWHLKMVDITVINNSDCSLSSDDKFCVRDDNSDDIFGFYTKTACQGDSGGPFVVNGTVYGVLSNGEMDEDGDCIGINVFTQVACYRNFIDQCLEQEEENMIPETR